MNYKVRIIVKVSNTKFVRYRVSNLLKFTNYLNHAYADWRYMNVYEYTSRRQIASFTKKNPPKTAKVF